MIPPPVRQGGRAGLRPGFVYLLSSNTARRFYLGWTTDLMRRLAQHNRGVVPSTRQGRPWSLIGYERLQDPDAAKKRERILKKNPRMRAFFTKRIMQQSLEAAKSGLGQVVG